MAKKRKRTAKKATKPRRRRTRLSYKPILASIDQIESRIRASSASRTGKSAAMRELDKIRKHVEDLCEPQKGADAALVNFFQSLLED